MVLEASLAQRHKCRGPGTLAARFFQNWYTNTYLALIGNLQASRSTPNLYSVTADTVLGFGGEDSLQHLITWLVATGPT